MGGIGLILTLVGVLALGSGVMVFKQSVEHERKRLAEITAALEDASARTRALRAELAFHRRPAYLAAFADELDLVPATPRHMASLDALPARPERDAEPGDPAPVLVALPSGQRTTLMRRPAQGSQP